jgi:uncharacterized protein (DUF433 family)
MNKLSSLHESPVTAVGIGSYTAPEAGALVGVAPRSVNRWLRGYASRTRRMAPLWEPQFETTDGRVELGFRDLIELRFVKAFMDAGVGLAAIRRCLDQARLLVEDDRPFSTRRFKTEGTAIFLANVEDDGLMDLKQRQYVFASVIERTFKDLDIEGDTVVRWRPFKGRYSIVIDPERAFGQPVAAASGVPVVALAEAVLAEGSIDRVARLFEVPSAVVRDAAAFQDALRRAA